MRWKGGRRSSNVDDRRGQGAGHSSAGAAPVLLRFLPALVRTKTGRTILIVAVIAIFGSRMLGIDLLPLLLGGGGATVQQADYQPTAEEEELVQFVSVVLADTEDTWNTVFAERGGSYKEPTLVLFTDRVNSACGMAGAAMGRFIALVIKSCISISRSSGIWRSAMVRPVTLPRPMLWLMRWVTTCRLYWA